MKKLNELQSLVKLAQNFGQDPDPKILAEIKYLQEQQDKKLKQQTELKARVHVASLELFEAPAKEYKRPSTYPDGKSIPANLPDLYQPASNAGVPENQRCDNCEYYVIESKKCTRWNNAVVKPAYWCAKWDPIAAKKQNEEVKIVKPKTAVDIVSNYIKESTVVGPEPVLAQPTPVLEQKVKQLEAWISRIAATGPGGGEVNLRWLDDVDRSNITDGQYLRYDGPTKKFTFDAGHHNNYYLAVQSSETQTSNATSATVMTFNVIDSDFGITITSNSRIVISNPGTYNLQFSSQFVNTANTPDDVYVWFRLNGTDVPASNSTVTIPAKNNNNVPGKIIASWNYLISTTSVGEYVELMWFAADDTHVTMPFISSIAATATSPTIPATPSVILTVTPVKVDSY
jgi:hypothetical protein